MILHRKSFRASPLIRIALLTFMAVAVVPVSAGADLLCDHCGKAITGQYIQYESGTYHVACYEDHVALRCDICGEIIDGQYIIDGRQNRYHPFHKDQLSRCAYCGCLISPQLTGDGHRYNDGREVCGLCLETAINDPDTARQIMLEAAENLKRFGIEVDIKKVPIYLVDSPRLRRLSGNRLDNTLGYTFFEKRSFLAGLVSRKSCKIYILHGLPRAKFQFGITHELMHVWLFRNCPLEMSQMLCEGSCDYAALLVTRESDEPESDRVCREAMENPDPVYGEGLRNVNAYVEQVGVANWLDYLKKTKKPPW